MFKILNAFSPLVKMIIVQIVTIFLKKFAEKEPEHCKVLLTSMYPVVDVELESFTDSTATNLDDAAVDGLKEAMENTAKEMGIVLANLDND